MVQRVTLSALEGINGTVFVYGQTGSGKTYTMLGKERMQQRRSLQPLSSESREEPGVLIYALYNLFQEIEKESESRTYFLRSSYVEIYND
jgi:Cdc6-like AAA superfamily ATPase